MMAVSMALMAAPNEAGLWQIEMPFKQASHRKVAVTPYNSAQNALGVLDTTSTKGGLHKKNCDYCRLPGPPGAPGIPGEPGLTGPVGREVIYGCRNYGGFYTISNGPTTIKPGDAISLTGSSVALRGMTLTTLGKIIIEHPGDYQVIFGVSGVQTSNSGSFTYGLTLNGNLVNGSKGGSFVDSQLTTLSTTLSIPPALIPATLSLVNLGINNLTLPDDSGTNSVSAFVTIKQMNHHHYFP